MAEDCSCILFSVIFTVVVSYFSCWALCCAFTERSHCVRVYAVSVQARGRSLLAAHCRTEATACSQCGPSRAPVRRNGCPCFVCRVNCACQAEAFFNEQLRHNLCVRALNKTARTICNLWNKFSCIAYRMCPWGALTRQGNLDTSRPVL